MHNANSLTHIQCNINRFSPSLSLFLFLFVFLFLHRSILFVWCLFRWSDGRLVDVLLRTHVCPSVGVSSSLILLTMSSARLARYTELYILSAVLHALALLDFNFQREQWSRTLEFNVLWFNWNCSNDILHAHSDSLIESNEYRISHSTMSFRFVSFQSVLELRFGFLLPRTRLFVCVFVYFRSALICICKILCIHATIINEYVCVNMPTLNTRFVFFRRSIQSNGTHIE